MSFRQATVLRLSKCFYRDTPQAVDLDQSYMPNASTAFSCAVSSFDDSFASSFCLKTTRYNFLARSEKSIISHAPVVLVMISCLPWNNAKPEAAAAKATQKHGKCSQYQ